MATNVMRPPLSDLRAVGGDLALDFVNTCSGPAHGPADAEWLSSYADFAAWSHRAGVAGPASTGTGPAGTAPGGSALDRTAPAGTALAGAAPAGTAPGGTPPGGTAPGGTAPIAAFARVLACRDDMYEIFLALADGSAPQEAALRRLHLAYVEALAHGQLASGAEGCAWRWDPGGDLLAPLWPIVAAAVELLTHGPADRIKSCGACRFLFVDQSKNGSRRWCSMDDCGKAAKIARYLQRRSGTQRREETG